ncbi:lipoprotein [Spiroplasma endosymbiont of Polydrusus cervinus]|uniref:lipoprotein n=1 Tax=Spiroplasma endosymbiont of Polydrusus cervinus TaxID=3066287 RepID=UPI0030CA7F2C
MKKLLSLLGAIAFTSSASTSTLVACAKKSFERFTEPEIADQVKRWIIAQINAEDASDVVKYSFNDIFTKAALKQMAIRLLDTNISKYFYASEEVKRAHYTGVSIDISQPDSLLIKQFINFVEQVALDNLSTKYFTGIFNSTPLETTIAGQGYAPDYQTEKWYVGGTQSYFWTGTSNIDYKKSRKEQEENNFKIQIKSAGNNYNDFNAMSENEKKAALKVRFKDYYIHVEVPAVIDKIITATYLHQNEIKRYGSVDNSVIYLNRNSALFNATQSWDTVSGARWKSYLKMVWELKLDKESLDKLFAGSGPLAKVEELNYNLTNYKNILTDILTKMFNNKQNNAFDNMIKDGIDPIFGISGFKGFVGINKSKNDIFTILSNADAYKQKIIDTATPGIIKSGEGTDPLSYQFLDANKRYGSVVLVLPIYTVDLMKNMNINYKADNKNNKELSLTWYGSGGAQTDLDQAWLAQQGGAKRSLSWLYKEKGYLGTHNETGSPLYNDKGAPIDIAKNTKGQILKWIEYTFAQQQNLQTAAKTRLYSLAFANNPENVYSQTLYNAIRSFIIKEED